MTYSFLHPLSKYKMCMHNFLCFTFVALIYHILPQLHAITNYSLSSI
uniref:Uncharacterized protein n=1 Tax=Arundo donax TaxID=35708 RepID=A0A0A9HA51_ARUDO